MPTFKRKSSFADSDYGDDIVAIDEDDLHEHLDGLTANSEHTIGSNKYTEEQKIQGAKETHRDYTQAISQQRSAQTRGSAPRESKHIELTLRPDRKGSDRDSETSEQTEDTTKNDKSITGLGEYAEDDDDDDRKIGYCGKGCFGDKGLPSDPIYNVTWVVTALVMALLKYVFCVVGAVIIHDSHRFMQPSLAVGIGVQCSSTLITGLITGRFSKIGINVSGPDIIASIFISSWVKTLCDGADPILSEVTALPTILFLMTASTLLMGILWFAIGYFHATKLVEFMPAPVVCGFLSCIGWKVVKYATKVSAGTSWYHTYSDENGWAFLLAVPGAVMGIPLYLLKKYHIGNPMVILPFYMVAPIVVFYISVALSGESMDDLRKNHWLFPKYDSAPFYSVWTELKFEHIDYNAIPFIMVDLCIMVIILVIDSLLKLASTKSGCKLDVDMVHEMKVTGYENIIGAMFMASPGYPQVKFNLLSYGILNNTRERRVAYFVALFGGAMWYLGGTGFMLIHYLPRFYLGGLLWYAACPFIVQNLVETYFHMEIKEYIIVLTIFTTVVIFDLAGNAAAMLIAVAVGAVMATFVFMSQYARVSVIREQYNLASELKEGKNYQSKVVRRYFEDALLARVANRTAYIQLEGFIFFASATQVLSRIKDLIKKSNDIVQTEKDFSSTVNQHAGKYGRILKVLKTEETHFDQYKYKIRFEDGSTTDDDKYYYVDHQAAVAVDKEGNVLGTREIRVPKRSSVVGSSQGSGSRVPKSQSTVKALTVGTRVKIIPYKVNEGRIGEYLRLRYVILDFEHVQSRSADGASTVGMDFSGLRTFVEVKRLLKEANIYRYVAMFLFILNRIYTVHICLCRFCAVFFSFQR